MNNYEKLYEAVKNVYGEYENLTYEEFLNLSDDEKHEFFWTIENVALDYFEGRDVEPEFEEAFDSYFQEDNPKNNEFRDNFKKIFEFAIRKLKLGGLTFEDVMNLKENAPERVALRDYLDRVFKAYLYKKLDRNSMLYNAIDDFYNSDVFKEQGNDFKIKSPVNAESFFRYGSKFKVTTSKVKNENNQQKEEKKEDKKEAKKEETDKSDIKPVENNKVKKNLKKVGNFLKEATKTVGFTILVSANALFGGLGAISAIAIALGANMFIPAWLPVLAIGVPAVTITGLVIKNKEKIKNKVKSIVSKFEKIKNKIKPKKEETNENTKENNKGQQVNNAGKHEEVDFKGLYDEMENEGKNNDSKFSDDEKFEDEDTEFSDDEKIEDNDAKISDSEKSEDNADLDIAKDEKMPTPSPAEEPIETTFTEDEGPETNLEEPIETEFAKEKPEAPEIPKEETKNKTEKDNNHSVGNKEKKTTKDYKNKLLDLKERLEYAKKIGKEDWIPGFEEEISKIEKIIEEREKKKQEITDNKAKLLVLKENLEYAKKIGKEDWIPGLESDVASLGETISESEKIKQDYINKKEKLEYLKHQLIYYKNLGRVDWISSTEQEIEKLAKEIANHDEDLDYPNEDISKGNR